ncbi:J domain-containing protein [bacterium]|nr:J domain-containing protein [bacterium]
MRCRIGGGRARNTPPRVSSACPTARVRSRATLTLCLWKGLATDHYRLLQVRRDASPEVISAAYRRLMKDAHPDAGGDPERARRLNHAYEVLSDPDSRRAYDAALPAEAQQELLHTLSYRLGMSIGRYAGRWSRGMREVRRHIPRG